MYNSMYKSRMVKGRDQVCNFLENMRKLGYNPKMQVIAITQDLDKYIIFYEYFEDLGEPEITY